MIATYLLGLPDHYKSNNFNVFYWQNFVREAMKSWGEVEEDARPEKVTLMKKGGKIIGFSPVYNYIFRPHELKDMSLWEWIGRCRREKKRTKKSNTTAEDVTESDTAEYDNLPEDNDELDQFLDADCEDTSIDSTK